MLLLLKVFIPIIYFLGGLNLLLLDFLEWFDFWSSYFYLSFLTDLPVLGGIWYCDLESTLDNLEWSNN